MEWIVQETDKKILMVIDEFYPRVSEIDAFHAQYSSPFLDKVGQLNDHIVIDPHCHRDHKRFGLIEVFSYHFIAVGIGMKIGKIADPVGTLEYQSVVGPIVQNPLQIR